MSTASVSDISNDDEESNYTMVELNNATEKQQMLANNEISIQGWPVDPQPLRGISAPKLLGDIFVGVLPIPFLVLIIAVLQINDQPLSEHGKRVQNALTLGPTLYPLVFAALCSRCLRTLAIWMAERGTTIETLEKLLRSQSFVSAISTSVTLRSINTISIPLLLLWALSPLGGQSSLRLMRETNSTIVSSGKLYYSDPRAPFYLNSGTVWMSVVPTVLLASLSASPIIRNGPIDLWQHPKIPRLKEIELDTDYKANSTGHWVGVEKGVNLTYSSLLGVNVQGLQSQMRSQAQINYSYMTVDCNLRYRDDKSSVFRQLSSLDVCIKPPLPSANQSAGGDALFNTTVLLNGKFITKMNEFLFKYGYNMSGTQGNQSACVSNDKKIGKDMYFLYGQMSYKKDKFHVYQCSPRFFTVEATLDCHSEICGVDRIRRIPDDLMADTKRCVDRDVQGQQPMWKLPCLSILPRLLNAFVDYFVMSTTSYSADPRVLSVYSIYDDFILGGNETYPNDPQDRDLDKVSDKLVSDRLSLVLNAYWQASSWGPLTTRMEPFSSPQLYESEEDMKAKGEIQTTNTTLKQTIPVYQANIPWCITLLFTTTVLLALGIFNLAMSWFTIAPDVFSYAASLTRGNPYTRVPNGGTALGGTERSRLLKELKVQIADVKPQDEVGHVALRSVEHVVQFQPGRLKKGRLYE